MAFDPNLYAIQIALSIDSGEAFKAVDELESRIGGIEESLSRALTQTLSGVVDVTSEISQSLGAMTGIIDDQNQRYVDQFDQLGETLERNTEATDEIQKQFDLNEDLQEIRKEMFELDEERQLLQQLALETIASEQFSAQELDDIYQAMGLTLEEIDELHERHGDNIDRNTTGSRRYRTEFQELLRTIDQVSDAMFANANALGNMTKQAEDFVTANFRAYGTQHDLLNAVAQTSAEYGVFTEQTQEAYKELMGIKVPIQLLDEYAGMVAQTSRITGVSIKGLAEYTRTMRGAGLELGDLAYVMNVTTAAQEAFGLTAAEVNKVLTEQLDKLSLMTSIYGNEVPADMAVAQSMFAGLAKQAGATAEAISKINEIMYATGSEALVLNGKLGPTFGEGTEGRAQAITDTFSKMGMELYNAQQSSEMTRAELDMLTIRLGAKAKALGGNIDMVTFYRNLIKESGGTIEGMTAAMENMRAEHVRIQDEQAAFNDSMNTLYASIQALNASIWALVSPFVNFIAQGMIPIISTAAFLIDTIGNVIGIFTGLWAALEDLIPPLYYVRMAAATLVAAFILIPPILTGIIGLMSVGANVFNIFGASIAFVQTRMAGFFARASVGLAQLGTMFISFMTTLGAGLNALGMAIAPVMLPLLALSGALLLTATAAYVFAQATAIIAEQGWAAAAAMAGIVVSVGLLGLVLVGLATLAQGPIALGLLAISVALLAVGAAAYMVGAGINLAATGMATLLNAIPPDIGARFLQLAAGLTALSLVAYFVTPGLLLLGYGLAAIALPAFMAGYGIQSLVTGLQALAEIELPDLGGKLLLLAIEIAAGALILSAVMTPLALAGVGLYLFATGLQQLSGFEVPDLGGKLIAMAGELWVGAIILGAVMTPLALAGVGLYLFATGLQQLSGFEAPDLGGKLIALAGELWVGAIILGAVMTPLMVAGAAIWVFAKGLESLSGIEIAGFGGKLIDLALEMALAAALILPAAAVLAMSAPALIAAGASLAIGGGAMLIGAIALGFSTSMLSRAIESLAGSSEILVGFTAAAERFAALNFSALNSSVVQLGNVSTNMVSHIDRLVTAAVRMENTQIDAKNFADSLTTAASQLDDAAKSLQGPAATLTTEIDGIVQQVERLIAAEAQIKEIGNDIAEVIQQPADNTQQPNEMRNVERVNEALNAMVEVKQDNGEMVALLARLVELMEAEAEAEGRKDREGFFQNEGGSQPKGDKFKEAGIDL